MKNNGLLLIAKLCWFFSKSALANRRGVVIISAIVLLLLWGTHGQMELLHLLLPAWQGPGSDPLTRQALIADIPWDQELISFWGGALLLVVVPSLIIKFGFRQSLAEYGLGLPAPGRGRIAFWGFWFLLLTCLPAFISGASEPAVRAVYPFFRQFDDKLQFALYELCYLPFFIVIEFVFRGYLLFGLTETDARDNTTDLYHGLLDDFRCNGHLLIISMLSYTAWHLGKPLAELWGTLYWGLAAGTVAFASRSIWPVVLSHWLLNVVLDAMVVY